MIKNSLQRAGFVLKIENDTDGCCLGCLLCLLGVPVLVSIISNPALLVIGLGAWGGWLLMRSEAFRIGWLDLWSALSKLGIDAVAAICQFSVLLYAKISSLLRFLFAYFPGSLAFLESRHQKKKSLLAKDVGDEIRMVESGQSLRRAEKEAYVRSKLRKEVGDLHEKAQQDLAVLFTAKRRMAAVLHRIKAEHGPVGARCPNCEVKFAVKPKYRGKKVRCPGKNCRATVRIPK